MCIRDSDCGAFQLDLPQYQAALLPRDGQRVVAGIRPEDLLVSRTGRDLQPIRCVLDRYENLGGRLDRKSTRLNSSHRSLSRMPSSA